jgi:uncharacterized protein (DUF4415 family)
MLGWETSAGSSDVSGRPPGLQSQWGASTTEPAGERDTRSRKPAVAPGYSYGMTMPKRKVSVSLDEDLVAELETADEALSTQVNEAIRAEVGRRRRNRLLTALLDSLDVKYGAVDEALVAKYVELL